MRRQHALLCAVLSAIIVAVIYFIEFVGVLEFPDKDTQQAFLNSAAFASYREVVGPTFANPPQTTPITAIASTRD